MVFEESDLVFNFDNQKWQVIKYDEHRFYKILSGAGLKGVDFLGIYDTQLLVFFEVKHFRHFHQQKTPSHQIITDPNGFVRHLARKIKDTHQAIQVIWQYGQRKWWFRLFVKTANFIPGIWRLQKDWYFWQQAHALSQFHSQQMLVVWLEMEATTPGYNWQQIQKNIDFQLKRKLSDDLNLVQIANRNNPVFAASLQVISASGK